MEEKDRYAKNYKNLIRKLSAHSQNVRKINRNRQAKTIRFVECIDKHGQR